MGSKDSERLRPKLEGGRGWGDSDHYRTNDRGGQKIDEKDDICFSSLSVCKRQRWDAIGLGEWCRLESGREEVRET